MYTLQMLCRAAAIAITDRLCDNPTYTDCIQKILVCAVVDNAIAIFGLARLFRG